MFLEHISKIFKMVLNISSSNSIWSLFKYPSKYLNILFKTTLYPYLCLSASNQNSGLSIYFKNNSISLTTNLKDYKEWQGGDIVVFTNHIAIVSDKRNYMGVPVIIHHSNRRQLWYEEDTISRYKIIGHYRIS